MSEHLNKELILGVDIGGSHISAALVERETGVLFPASLRKRILPGSGDTAGIVEQWTSVLQDSLKSLSNYRLAGIGVAIPGPFDYEQGISLMKDVNKYSSLFGVSIKDAFREKLLLDNDLPIVFENDAACFGIGESLGNGIKSMDRIIAVTLGTGFGSTFLQNGRVVKQGKGLPANGELYNVGYLDGITEDYISGKWILSGYNARSPLKAASVKMIAERAAGEMDAVAIGIFKDFGFHLASCLEPWIKSYKADSLVIGGSIARSSQLFISRLITELRRFNCLIPVKISEHMEVSAIKGAASLVTPKSQPQQPNWRKTRQPLLPVESLDRGLEPGDYNMYPSFSLGSGKIHTGYDTLADWIGRKRTVMIDGLMGNDWNAIQAALSEALARKGIHVKWYDAAAWQHAPTIIEKLAEPFIGATGEVWGTRCTLDFADMFNAEALAKLEPAGTADVHILIGTGAALANWDDLVYFDLPKNEVQFRMRSGQQVSIVPGEGLSNPEIYKRLYFVDWVLNNRHRAAIQDNIKIIADGQWKDTVTWAESSSIYQGFRELSTSVFRARPWFEPGAWGGQWLKNKIKGISQDEVNYAWSFELIVPENGLVFESDRRHLEVAFDWLMEWHADTILGQDHQRFGKEFPIRFDYLDTMDGGNLSIQCHPSLSYIRNVFGENITQDETYYILDCKPDARVYLGFQEDIDPAAFRNQLEASVEQNLPVDIEKFVQVHPAKKHDLFLIPNQTVHSAGKNNMVLEISATPYIFTFKMYDWLRLDLEGNPRPINIEHAFNNLDFSRKGEVVQRDLVSREQIIESNKDYRIVHLPTHPEHFYDVHRIEFSGSVDMATLNKCFVMMLVEGQSILVKAEGREPVRFSYAETFVVPAGVNRFSLFNETEGEIKVIKAFVK